MKTINVKTYRTAEAAIAKLKVGDVIQVPGYSDRVTVTRIDWRCKSLWPVLYTTGKTEWGCTLTADARYGGVVLTDRDDTTAHHSYMFKIA